MVKKVLLFLPLIVSSILLTGCNEPSQTELLSKVKGADTPAAVEAAIGKPSEIKDEGALKLWRYEASEGPICFSIVGQVAMRMSCS
ncbi:MAG: hypothetical protein JJ879_07055 [Sneathiella sp.]|nr:hypothetical protein [Sneathiella sp.]